MSAIATPSKTLTLYDLAEERVALDALLDMDEGEFGPEAEALEIELTGKLVTKADAFGGYVRELEATSGALGDEIKRLTERRDAIKNRAERLKRFGMMALQAMDRPRVEGTLFTLALQNNPPSVQIDVLPGALPLAFVRHVPEQYVPDKVAIGKALKAGETIHGCSLVQTQSLRIK